MSNVLKFPILAFDREKRCRLVSGGWNDSFRPDGHQRNGELLIVGPMDGAVMIHAGSFLFEPPHGSVPLKGPAA